MGYEKEIALSFQQEVFLQNYEKDSDYSTMTIEELMDYLQSPQVFASPQYHLMVVLKKQADLDGYKAKDGNKLQELPQPDMAKWDNEDYYKEVTGKYKKYFMKTVKKNEENVRRINSNRSWIWRFFKGEEDNPKLKKLIEIAFMVPLSVELTNELLCRMGFHNLSERDWEEAIIIYCLMQKKTYAEYKKLRDKAEQKYFKDVKKVDPREMPEPGLSAQLRNERPEWSECENDNDFLEKYIKLHKDDFYDIPSTMYKSFLQWQNHIRLIAILLLDKNQLNKPILSIKNEEKEKYEEKNAVDILVDLLVAVDLVKEIPLIEEKVKSVDDILQLCKDICKKIYGINWGESLEAKPKLKDLLTIDEHLSNIVWIGQDKALSKKTLYYFEDVFLSPSNPDGFVNDTYKSIRKGLNITPYEIEKERKTPTKERKTPTNLDRDQMKLFLELCEGDRQHDDERVRPFEVRAKEVFNSKDGALYPLQDINKVQELRRLRFSKRETLGWLAKGDYITNNRNWMLCFVYLSFVYGVKKGQKDNSFDDDDFNYWPYGEATFENYRKSIDKLLKDNYLPQIRLSQPYDFLVLYCGLTSWYGNEDEEKSDLLKELIYSLADPYK